MALNAVLTPNDGYLFFSPSSKAWSNIDEDIASLLRTGAVREVHFCSIAPNGAYVFCYMKPDGKNMLLSSKLPEKLARWLVPVPGKGVTRDIPSLAVCLGPNNSYFGWDKSGLVYGSLPDEFNAGLASRHNAQGKISEQDWPKSVELGPDGTFVYITEGGGGFWSSNLWQHNPPLAQYLSNAKSLKNDMHPHYNTFVADWDRFLGQLRQNVQQQVQQRQVQQQKNAAVRTGFKVGIKLLTTIIAGYEPILGTD
ncbi:hypothetical protein DV736_g1399, partial [Chaetothyriales sp. CBS 134916]